MASKTLRSYLPTYLSTFLPCLLTYLLCCLLASCLLPSFPPQLLAYLITYLSLNPFIFFYIYLSPERCDRNSESDEAEYNPRGRKDGNLYLQITFHLVFFSICCLINNSHYLYDSFCDTWDRDAIRHLMLMKVKTIKLKFCLGGNTR